MNCSGQGHLPLGGGDRGFSVGGLPHPPLGMERVPSDKIRSLVVTRKFLTDCWRTPFLSMVEAVIRLGSWLQLGGLVKMMPELTYSIILVSGVQQ